MKEYLSRLKRGCKTHTFILWWVLRLTMLLTIIFNINSAEVYLSEKIQLVMCFLGSFMWELSMAMPEKSIFRLMPPSLHTVINLGLTASAVLGVGFDMYYNLRFFDAALQAFFSFVAVLYGYEIAYALVKKEHFSATKAMVYYVAFGVSFMWFNGWELGEFFTDQLIGHLTGTVGNSQFWSQVIADGTARSNSIIPALVSEREPLMDIMCDVIVHSVSAFAGLIFINVCPYRLRGKYKYDIEYGNNASRVKENVNSWK